MASFNNSAVPCIKSDALISCFGPSPATARGEGIHVNSHPKDDNKIIYGSGKHVVVMDLDNPSSTFVYRGHNANVTIAKFAPNGFWVASGDVSGKIRVWSWDNPEHLCKLDTIAFAGPIKDLDWDPESKRILACGGGSGGSSSTGGGMVVKCIMWDTGNTVGEMVGHGKVALSCAYRTARPYRAISGGMDFRTVFYKGPPFKMDHSNGDVHTNYVNCVRYSQQAGASGGTDFIVSVGSDKAMCVYEGGEGQPIATCSNIHNGTVYSVAWGKNPTTEGEVEFAGNTFATASADKTIKVWDIDSVIGSSNTGSGSSSTGGGASPLKQWSTGPTPTLGDMQVAVTHATGGGFVSVSLDGSINQWSMSSEYPVGVVQSHQSAITAIDYDTNNAIVITGSSDGAVCGWLLPPPDQTSSSSSSSSSSPSFASNAYGGTRFVSPSSHAIRAPTKAPHTNKVSGLCLLGKNGTDGGQGLWLASVGWDDRLRLARVVSSMVGSDGVGIIPPVSWPAGGAPSEQEQEQERERVGGVYFDEIEVPLDGQPQGLVGAALLPIEKLRSLLLCCAAGDDAADPEGEAGSYYLVCPTNRCIHLIGVDAAKGPTSPPAVTIVDEVNGLPYDPTTVALNWNVADSSSSSSSSSSGGGGGGGAAIGEIAVGGRGSSNVVAFYKIYRPPNGSTLDIKLRPLSTIPNLRGAVSALAFSPSGNILAVGDTNREVSVYQRNGPRSQGQGQEWSAIVSGVWVYHTTRITSLAFLGSDRFLASGSLDESVYVWDLGEIGPYASSSANKKPSAELLANRRRRRKVPFAHKDGVSVLGTIMGSGSATGGGGSGRTVVVSGGNDGCLCLWDLEKMDVEGAR